MSLVFICIQIQSLHPSSYIYRFKRIFRVPRVCLYIKQMRYRLHTFFSINIISFHLTHQKQQVFLSHTNWFRFNFVEMSFEFLSVLCLDIDIQYPISWCIHSQSQSDSSFGWMTLLLEGIHSEDRYAGDVALSFQSFSHHQHNYYLVFASAASALLS